MNEDILENTELPTADSEEMLDSIDNLQANPEFIESEPEFVFESLP
jgi:hypothetical protein